MFFFFCIFVHATDWSVVPHGLTLKSPLSVLVPFILDADVSRPDVQQTCRGVTLQVVYSQPPFQLVTHMCNSFIIFCLTLPKHLLAPPSFTSPTATWLRLCRSLTWIITIGVFVTVHLSVPLYSSGPFSAVLRGILKIRKLCSLLCMCLFF